MKDILQLRALRSHAKFFEVLAACFLAVTVILYFKIMPTISWFGGLIEMVSYRREDLLFDLEVFYTCALVVEIILKCISWRKWPTALEHGTERRYKGLLLMDSLSALACVVMLIAGAVVERDHVEGVRVRQLGGWDKVSFAVFVFSLALDMDFFSNRNFMLMFRLVLMIPQVWTVKICVSIRVLRLMRLFILNKSCTDIMM